MSVKGGHYPPAPTALAVNRFVVWAQMVLLACVLFGEALCAVLKVPVPGWMKDLHANKFQSAMMTYVFGNFISTNALNTGAFEVFFDGDLISSKLSTGALPKIDVIFNAIRDKSS